MGSERARVVYWLETHCWASPESPENKSSLGTGPLASLAELLLQQNSSSRTNSLFPEGYGR